MSDEQNEFTSMRVSKDTLKKVRIIFAYKAPTTYDKILNALVTEELERVLEQERGGGRQEVA